MKINLPFLCAVTLALSAFGSRAAEKPFLLQPGEFPPEGSAHYIAGELIALDHVNRTGVLRPDRTDAQRRSDWDYPHPFTMLPFGSFGFHGASAELRNIPIGTHLHGWFYQTPAEPKSAKDSRDKRGAAPKIQRYERLGIEAAYNLALRLEDDFTSCVRQQRTWRVDDVDLEKGALTATGITAGKADAKPTIFQIFPGTRVWKGRGFGALTDLAAGQSILLNITYATLKGPGRCTDIWLDAESRATASAQQFEIHRQSLRERGFAAWIDAVDNEKSIVTATLFSSFDPKLKEIFRITHSTNDVVTTAVAEENLRTYDQTNDRKRGTMLEALDVPAPPGSSGLQVKFKPELLLEGFRPKRFIRLFPGPARVDDIPREERLYQ
jgi:hypothetical protein